MMSNLFEITLRKYRPAVYAIAASACIFGVSNLTPSSSSLIARFEK
jgi:hypothetical protein